MDRHWIRYSINWSKFLIKKYKWSLFWLIILMMFSVSLSLVKVNFIQQSIDAILVKDINKLFKVGSLFIGITFFRLIYDYIYGNHYKKIFVYMEKDLKIVFAFKLLKSKMKEIDHEKSGDLNIKSSSDIPNSLEFIKQIFSNFILNPIMTLAGFFYLFFYNWKLSILVFIPIPILAILLNKLSSRSSYLYKSMQELNSIYSDGIYDTIHGMETIKAYNMQGMQIQKLRKVLYKILEETRKYDVNIAITLACILAVTYIPMVITFIFGAYLVNIGEIEVSLLFGYSQLIGPISSPIINLFSSTTAMKNACQSMKRLDTVMNMEEEREGGSKLVPEGKMAVVFHKVSFGYDINKKIFRKLSFNIKRGQCIGIVGNSGEGKTTIVKLICGLYEIDEGQIRIFGSDIKDLDIDCLRKNIAYISQNAYILPGTIAENVRCGNNNITDEEVKIALSQAGLKEYVDNLPNGIHTVLHEGGMNLSGGQRQKIALARIFLHKALFYIFDEPTASMDISSEKEVITKVHELIRQNDAAGIIISHNFEIIKKCDEVWFVKNGILRETGTFEELIRQKGFFYNQFYMQGTKI